MPGAGPDRKSRATRFESWLVAVLKTGTELDQVAALVQLPLASDLAGLGTAVSPRMRVATGDLFDVTRIGWELMNNIHWAITPPTG